MIKWLYNKDLNQIDVTYSGLIEVDDILNFIKEIGDTPNIPRKLFILTDATNAIFNFKINEIYKIRERITNPLKKYTIVVDAFVVDKPDLTAMAILYQLSTKELKKYTFNIFSTKEAAINLLEKYKCSFVTADC